MTYIRKKVESLIDKHHSNCPFEIAQSKGIFINYADLGETLGFYLYDSRFKFININQNLDENRQRFVCAHELGHSILHPEFNTPFMKKNTFYSIDKIEVEANTFAVELLLTDEIVSEYKDSNLSINEVAGIHGVPKEVAHLKNICNFNRGDSR